MPKTNDVIPSVNTSSVSAKDAKDLTKAAKDKKAKDKSDYDKLSESQKQAIRDPLIAAAVAVIDVNITEAANRGAESYTIPKFDALLSSMDDVAITQLMTLYTTPGQGNQAFTCVDAGGALTFGWVA